MRCARLAVVLGALLTLLPAFAFAQASIAGVVKDPSGAVLPGVTVEAASPALIERVKSVSTDSSGQYRIVDLRPGTYSVTFTLPGFNTVKREGVELAGSFTATISVELKIGALNETVTVTGESPVVDIQSVTQQKVLGQDVIDNIPSSRTHFSVGNLISSVSSNNTADVGGTNAIAHVTLAAHGGRGTDQRVMLDGLATSNAEGSGHFSGYTPNISSTQELTVDTAAGSADQPTGGVRMNIIPREGGNLFKGTFYASGANSAMSGSNFTDELRRRGATAPNDFAKVWDINPGFGGPIAKDRLWFYAAARWNGENIYTGIFYNKNAGDPTKWLYVPDESRIGLNMANQRSINGRVTWQANERHKISFFYDDQHRCWCPRQLGGRNAPEAANSSEYKPNNLVSATWTAPLSSRLLVEAGFSNRHETWAYRRVPVDQQMIGVIEQSTGLSYRAETTGSNGGIWPTGPGVLTNVRASAAYVTGTHAVKVGMSDGYVTRQLIVYDTKYGLSYRFNNGIPNQITERQTPIEAKSVIKADLGIYAQDKWTMKRMTLNLGVRYDYFNDYFPAQHVGPAPLVPTRDVSFPKTPWVSWSDITPRMGMSYDLFGNGKTALKVTLNKYMVAFGLQGDFGDGSNPVQRLTGSVTRSWNDGNGDFTPQCDLINPAANGECGAMSNLNFGKPVLSTQVDPSILKGWGKRAFNWEYSTSVQHELMTGVSMEVGYFRRWYGNFTATDNRAVTAADYSSFSVTAPADPRLPNGGGYVVSGLMNLNPNKVGQVDNLLTLASNYGDQTEYWHGVDLSMNTRFGRGTLLQGGLSTGRTVTDNCDILANVPELDPVGRPYCHQTQKFRTQFKGFGAFTVPVVDVQLSATYQNLPGPQILASYVATNAQVQGSLGRPLSGGAANVTANLVEPGTMFGERVNQLDMRVARVLRLGRTRSTVSMDLFNLLNANTVLTLNNNYASWQQPTSILQARFVKFGVQVDF